MCPEMTQQSRFAGTSGASTRRGWPAPTPRGGCFDHVTVKFCTLVALPTGVLTMILPVVAPAGTVAVIVVGVLTTNEGAITPLNLTTVAPVKFVPVIVTEVPTGPEVGRKLVIVGADPPEGTVKFVELVPVPPAVVTEIGPVVAPAGTAAFTLMADLNKNPVPVTPLNFTTDDGVKFVPLTVTSVPTTPEVGEKLVIVGIDPPEDTVKFVELVPVPRRS